MDQPILSANRRYPCERVLKPALWLGLLLAGASAAGCGSSGSSAGNGGADAGGNAAPDAGRDGGAHEADAGTDAGGDAGGPAPATLNQTFEGKPLARAASDRFTSVAFGPDGKIYAAGYITVTVPSDAADGGVAGAGIDDRRLAVARLDLKGKLDTSFGDLDESDASKRTGIATVNLFAATAAFPDAETAKAIAVQRDGKIVVGGTYQTGKVAAELKDANDTTVSGSLAEVDAVVLRLTATGELDTDFASSDTDGKDGMLVLDFGAVLPAIQVNASTGAESLSALNDDIGDLDLDSQGRIVIYARGKGPGDATDTDRYVLRLDTDGNLDASFGTAGRTRISTPGTWNDNARTGSILAGDQIISAGYTVIDSKANIVLARLDASGQPVKSFGTQGVLVSDPFYIKTAPATSGFVEAYGAMPQSNGDFVTTGYGQLNPNSPTPSVYSFRYSPTGKLDSAWGTGGFFGLDRLPGAASADVGPEQARNIAVLPDDRVIMVGTGQAVAGKGDGFVVLVSKDGKADGSFGDGGVKVYDLGLSGDQFSGLAVSPDGRHVAVAGYSGAVTSSPISENVEDEDAALVVYSLTR